MHRPLLIVALAAVFIAPTLQSHAASSANYSLALSIDGGGRHVTSQNYAATMTVTPIARQSAAPVAVVMVTGFGALLNSGPVAEDDIRSRPPNAGVSFLVSSLFANDFDPDGDPLTLFRVDQRSAQGGIVSTDGQTIAYTPPTGFTGSDQFDYIVADASGEYASATVFLGTAPPVGGQGLNTVLIAKQADGKYLVRFRQVPGRSEYTIQYKHDLNENQWQTLRTVEAGSDGVVEAIFDPSEAEQTFFRALSR